MNIEYTEPSSNKSSLILRRTFLFTSAVIFSLLIWQTISASKIHQSYQESLMDSVTERILAEYQEYFDQLRLEIDLFQQKQINELNKLHTDATEASIDDYKVVLERLRSSIKHTRLFALIDEDGQGSLKHITGDFLPSCEKEIASTVAAGSQKKLFLHRTSHSVHFDLLQPLSTTNSANQFLFVAFNTDVLDNLLTKYQLPFQQLFLMRADNIGEIELTTEDNNEKYASMKMDTQELNEFSHIKTIPDTRWHIAIRLAPEYSSNLYFYGLTRAIAIWLILSIFMYIFYRHQKINIFKHLQIEKELAFISEFDQLTGLTNRASFELQLSNYIKSCSDNSGIVLHLDIDNFQTINNNFGFTTGDKYLYHISISLKNYLPNNSIISRLGNDEFAILLPSVAHSSAKKIANELRLYFKTITIEELSKAEQLTTSIGVVILDNSMHNGEQVFLSLSQALNLAKEKGRNRVQLYQSDDELLIQHAREMEAVNDASVALKNDNLVLYRQQIKNLKTGSCSHYEVLVRMKSVSGELIPPIYFVPAAEKHGLIRQIDRWVIENTFKKMSEDIYDHSTIYSINLSGATLVDKDIYNDILSYFEQYEIAPERICFEVTETSAITHLKSAFEFIKKMKEFGCDFSLDDFGSGLSSFSYLQKLPVSIIKIDGCFVRDMDTNDVNRIFVENIRRTAISMNKKTIAEFVENAEIEEMLTDIGIDYGQGYHIHKPEPWNE